MQTHITVVYSAASCTVLNIQVIKSGSSSEEGMKENRKERREAGQH